MGGHAQCAGTSIRYNQIFNDHLLDAVLGLKLTLPPCKNLLLD